MNRHQEDLILYALGELEGQERAELERALREDAALREELEEVKRSLDLVSANAPVDPEPAYWRSFYSRLRPQLQHTPLWRRFVNFFIPDSGFKLAGAIATIAVMFVVVGVVLWQFIADHEPADDDVRQSSVIIKRTDGYLQHIIGDHLERTRLLLQDLVNIRTDGPDAQLLLADSRERGEMLLSDNRTYLLAAEREQDGKMQSLLNELDLVLVEIANMQPDMAEYRLPSLKRIIRSKNLLIKIEIINLDQVDAAPQSGESKEVL